MNLDEQTAAELVATWVGEVCGVPAERRFPYPQATKTAELPDVAAAVTDSRVQRGPDDEDFPLLMLEQTWLNLFVVEFSIMVDQGSGDGTAESIEAAAQTAQQAVYGYAKALREAIIDDPTLDGALDASAGVFASPLIAFDFREPFVEYDDGTRGRIMPGVVRLAEAIPEPG